MWACRPVVCGGTAGRWARASGGGAGPQGAFGRQALGVTSFFTYVGLGLGFLGSALALPFGLYILILQREPESTLQDSVTAPSSSRQARLPLPSYLPLPPFLPHLAPPPLPEFPGFSCFESGCIAVDVAFAKVTQAWTIHACLRGNDVSPSER